MVQRFAPTALRIAFASMFIVAALPSSAEYLLRPGMPDHDQIRTGLPGTSPGGMYCVPTSSYNLLRFLKDEVGLWGIPVAGHDHSTRTNAIFALGFLMGTDAQTGTGGSAPYQVVKSTIAANEEQSALVTHHYYDWNSADWGVNKLRSVAYTGLARIGYGRFKHQGDGIYARSGGHSVMIAGWEKDSTGSYIYVADPASTNGNPDTQGAFTFERKQIWNETRQIHGWGIIPRARYTNWTGNAGDMIALIDSMHHVMPIYAGWFESDVDTSPRMKAPGDGSVRVSVPWTFDKGKPLEFKFSPKETLVDWTFQAGEQAVYYVTKTGRVLYVDLKTGRQKLIRTIANAKGIMQGGFRGDLFLLVDGAVADSVVRIDLGTGKLKQRLLPGKVSSMHYQPRTHGPAFLDASQTLLWAYGSDLGKPIKTALPTVVRKGEIAFGIDPNSGDPVWAIKGKSRLSRLTIVPGKGEVLEEFDTGVSIQHLVATENNMVAVQTGKMLRTFSRIGRKVSTQLSAISPLSNVKLSATLLQGDPSSEVGQPYDNWFPDPGLLQND